MPAETSIEGIVRTSDCKHQVSLKVESAHQDDGPFISFTANVWDRLQLDSTPAGVKDLRDRPFLKDLQLADPDFHSDASIDLLLGCKECIECERPVIREDEDGRAKAYNSIFGWIVGGSFPSDGKVDWRKVICCNKTNPADTELSRALQAFWKVEDTQDGNPLRTEDENIACAHFADTHTRNEEGCYRVALPRTTPVPELGESRRTAV